MTKKLFDKKSFSRGGVVRYKGNTYIVCVVDFEFRTIAIEIKNKLVWIKYKEIQ